MNTNTKKEIKLSLIAVSIASLTACGGGGGSTSAPVTTSNNNIDYIDDSVNKEEIIPLKKKTLLDLNPYGRNQWHLENTGQLNNSSKRTTAGFDINVLPVWEMGYTGKGVNIMVADSMIDNSHEDLSSNIKNSFSVYCLNTGTCGVNEFDVDTVKKDSHGTSVAGIIASSDNDVGGVGVAYGANLINYDYIDSQSFGDEYEDIILGVENPDISIDINSIDIINMSYGYSSGFVDYEQYDIYSIAVLEAFFYYEEYFLSTSIKTTRGGKGIVYLASAGNEYSLNLLEYPNQYGLSSTSSTLSGASNHKYKMMIGSINGNGKKANYSSTGANIWLSSTGGSNDRVTPAIVTTKSSLGCENNEASFGEDVNCKYTKDFAGTSASTPTVSGVVALMLEANPELTYRDVKMILAKTARKIDQQQESHDYTYKNLTVNVNQGWVTNAAGNSFSNWYGFGLVDAKSAVDMALSWKEKGYSLPEEKVINSDEFTTLTEKAISGESQIKITLDVLEEIAIENVVLQTGIRSKNVLDPESNIHYAQLNHFQIEVISPNGTRSIVYEPFGKVEYKNYGFKLAKLLTNAFLEESSIGQWTIIVTPVENYESDRIDTEVQVEHAKLIISGH